MHAFLVQSTGFPSSLYTLTINPDTSIGIEDIRQIQKFISIKPPANQLNRVIVNSAHKMTIPAQNAFLKTLEEPPKDSEIYLVTKYPDQLLPTILSRVEIQKPAIQIYTSDTLSDSRTLFAQLQKLGVGEGLAVIDGVNFDRSTFLHFLDDLEYILHENLSSCVSFSPSLYSLICLTRRYLNANCNLRLTLDNFFLTFQSLKKLSVKSN